MSTIAALTNAIKTMEASIAELRSALAEATSAEAMPQAMPEPEPKAKRAPSAWITFVGKTLQDMRENGWESWVDAEGILWHASTFNGEGHVYSAGPRSGKQASYPDALKLASFRNIQNKSQEERPAAAAAAKAYIEKREKGKAARDAKKAASESDAESSGQKKAGRPKMTEEQKASAKAARAAKKAASESDAESSGQKKAPKIAPKTKEQKAAAKERQKAAANAQHHALKAAAAAGEPEAIATLVARECERAGLLDQLAAMQSESESEGTLIGGGGGGGGSVEPKKKRKPLTEEQKAAAKAKRDAKKAATTLNLPGEWAELE